MTETLIIDSREKKPLRFPGYVSFRFRGQVHTHKLVTPIRPLSTGDYALLGREQVAIVERKGSIGELHANLLTRDRSRFLRELDRMADDVAYAAVLLDFPVNQAFQPTRYWEHPSWALDALLVELVPRKISLLWVPPSRNICRTGEVVVKWLLAATLEPP